MSASLPSRVSSPILVTLDGKRVQRLPKAAREAVAQRADATRQRKVLDEILAQGEQALAAAIIATQDANAAQDAAQRSGDFLARAAAREVAISTDYAASRLAQLLDLIKRKRDR